MRRERSLGRVEQRRQALQRQRGLGGYVVPQQQREQRPRRIPRRHYGIGAVRVPTTSPPPTPARLDTNFPGPHLQMAPRGMQNEHIPVGPTPL